MEMRIPASWVIAGALAIGLTSCAGEDTATTPTPSTSPSATDATASPSPSTDPKSQTFSKPLVSEKGKEGTDTSGKGGKDKKIASKGLNTIAGLTKSTDPDEQAKKVQAQINSTKANRSDPFKSLPPLVAFKTPKVPSSLPLLPGTGSGTTNLGKKETSPATMPEMPKFPDVIKPKPVARFRPFSPSPIAARPIDRPNSPSIPGGIPTMPPIPQPTLAREVEVTGVVTIGNTTQAIVKAPNEPSSRYVSVGQRLANGQVLVKRIDMNPGSDPVVILEENGIEVPVVVGAKKAPKL
jgi:hypothetical protein